MRLHLDLETACDLDLKKVGLWRYVSHRSFQVLLTAWAVDDGPVEQCEGLWDCPYIVDTYHAFNAPFEMAVLASQGLPIDPSRWRCTMSHAYARGFSGRLSDVGAQVGLPEEERKLKSGGRLINWFCVQRKEDRGERWDEFKLYNRMDVEAERAICRKLNAWGPWTEEEQSLWELDREINLRGILVDLPMVAHATRVAEQERRRLAAECKRLCGVSPSQTGALLKWAQANGYYQETLRAADIEAYLKDPIPF